MRKTYTIPSEQLVRLLKVRESMAGASGGKVSWQLVLRTLIEAGLRSMGLIGESGKR